jgi:ParB family chromosome partitioning protein
MTEPREAKTPEESELDPNTKAAVEALEQALGTRVRIVARSGERGRIEIEYYSQEDLQRLYDLLVSTAN